MTRTNITEPASNFTSSRGTLVSSFLLSEDDNEAQKSRSSPFDNDDYVDSPATPDLEKLARKLYPREAKYAGFNLLLLAPNHASTKTSCHATTKTKSIADANSSCASPVPDLEENDIATSHHALSVHPERESQPQSRSQSLHYSSLYLTNSGAGGPITARSLSSQEKHCGGFSNGIDAHGGSEWPKVVHGVQEMEKLIAEINNDGEATSRGESSTGKTTTATQSGPIHDDIDDDCKKELQDRRLADRLFNILAWESPEPVTERVHLRRTIHVHPLQVRIDSKAKPTSESTTRIHVGADSNDNNNNSDCNKDGVRTRNQQTSANADPADRKELGASFPTPPLTTSLLSQDAQPQQRQEAQQPLSESTSSPALSVPVPASIPVPSGENKNAKVSSSSSESQSQSNAHAATGANGSSSSESLSASSTATMYGTRLSTVILIRRNGDVMFIERDIWKMINGEVARIGKDSERMFRFRLDGY
ncbi:hypothetical protein D9758_018454 [Tetrapyrgos nigripes]|uniref:Uncharacterized protein n=1 Tax=Tetrapyrgos nigripes TaxID=182062 RepID=A0A8H5F190_9AGAR|nr:hypothetical protein D9758_018454 [Tetrapyrgos nigripes]